MTYLINQKAFSHDFPIADGALMFNLPKNLTDTWFSEAGLRESSESWDPPLCDSAASAAILQQEELARERTGALAGLQHGCEGASLRLCLWQVEMLILCL